MMRIFYIVSIWLILSVITICLTELFFKSFEVETPLISIIGCMCSSLLAAWGIGSCIDKYLSE